ncbi:MAG: hypothetical protein AB2392_13225 [Neobacillus sp.]
MGKLMKMCISITIVLAYAIIGTSYYYLTEPGNTMIQSFFQIDSGILLWIVLLTRLPILSMIAILLFLIGKYAGLIYVVYWLLGPANRWKKCFVLVLIFGIFIGEDALNREFEGFIPGP